ncbi:cobaltochelatase CobN [Desulfosarcina sp. BuS5]|uniref:cobaltochelatase subunit CobN n=1 Tax=Desulfosarcina sp. BuS5 TaxID=933262 RepID=UPI00048467F5|nr:cobaltochelatase subunit CobN [Desulfosarcina sp. BuS5]WDN88744.1 cobaltochelatase CobN [Desulfosarcina sp. BuS5]
MKPFTLCYFTAHSMEIPSLSAGVRQYEKQCGKIRVIARTGRQLFDESRIKAFVKDALASDVVLIILHGGKASCPAFDPLMEAVLKKKNNGEKIPYFHIYPQGSDEDGLIAAKEYDHDFGTDRWDTLNRYLMHGGRMNFYNLFCYLYNLLFQDKAPCNPPETLPQEGIYHPDFQEIPDLKEYLKEKIDPKKITVGLWFYQSYWLNDNLRYIDAVIREVERCGANVICVFHLRYKDADRGNRGADYVVEQFFMENGKSVIDVLISPMMFSLTLSAPEYKDLLPWLNVPFIQAITTMNPYAEWKESLQGISTMDVSYSVAQPEFDGALITVPVATREEEEIDPLTGALLSKNMPIPDRVEKMVSLSLNWAKLRKIKNQDKRIAIIFHHYPPRNDRIGCAAGLDSFESVKLLLDRMKKEGFQVDQTYETGDELAKDLLDRMTCDQRWLTSDRMAEKAEAHAGRDLFLPWHEALPPSIRKKMTADWGEIPGDLFVHEEKMHFAGLINGNLFITIQPPRGYFENIEKIYHDMYLSTPHHYLAQYRWIKDVFRADAVMHVGKHGSLEWLPGKALGLSDECYPDLAIMDLPNIYPYIINDPSEGTQAKRRSYCCIIDHLTPVFTNADLYEDLAKVENVLKEYADAKIEDPGKISILRSMIWEAVCQADLDKDLELDEKEAFSDFDLFLEKLHSYLSELGDTMINDGLHIMGKAPENDRLVEFLVQLTRLSSGDVPSLRESVLGALGYDYDELLVNKGRVLPHFKEQTGGRIIQSAHEACLEMVKKLEENRFDTAFIDTIVESCLGRSNINVAASLSYICEVLTPNIRLVTEEIDSSLTGFNGGFVLPGPSGAPTRGQADILPTGRNFYSVDPNKIPTPGAWDVGKRLGNALIERCLKETGKYPENIGIIVWGGSTMRSKGDDIAEIYYLMGVKPVWAGGSGNVTGLEVIPLSELGRPRLDVTPRISGFFRDSFPNLVERIDEAVRMVAALKESPESNILRRNVLRDVNSYIKEGMTEKEAMREATFRVFGCPPGTYGAGVSELVESKNWKTREDLGNNYIRYTAHAYGKGSYGKQKPAAFRNLLSRMDLTVKNEDSREYDMMSCTDFYNYYGGLIVASKTVRGKLPFAMVGDSADPKRVKMRTTFEEAKHVLRSRLVNPKWLEGMKRHGYKGAGDISHMMDVVLGWDATAEVIDDWMYKKIAEKYALDPEMQEWMKEVNPYALQNILDKLLEAISRGMWDADKEMENELREAYLEMEGEIEELTE